LAAKIDVDQSALRLILLFLRSPGALPACNSHLWYRNQSTRMRGKLNSSAGQYCWPIQGGAPRDQ